LGFKPFSSDGDFKTFFAAKGRRDTRGAVREDVPEWKIATGLLV